MNTNQSKKMGFTLVEVMVVVAAITLLMGILLPVLGNVRENGRVAQCANNQRQLGIANQSFANDNKGRFVTAPIVGSSNQNNSSVNAWASIGPISDYVLYGRLYSDYLNNVGSVYYCPSAGPKGIQSTHIDYGLATLGVQGKTTFSNYFQRGARQDAPVSVNNLISAFKNSNDNSPITYIRDGKARRVLIADIYQLKGGRYSPNHQEMVLALISDLSVERLKVTPPFYSSTASEQYGEDSPDGSSGSWNRLDSMID